MILASASPRRQQLLAFLGIPFTVQSADIDESALPNESPEAHALRLAETKARVVAAALARGEITLAADTIVVQHGRILGKPQDVSEARYMLQSLRAAPHHVITAVVIANHMVSPAQAPHPPHLPPDPPSLLSGLHTSRVSMRPYSDAEIDVYIASGDPMDKAGAYAIQSQDFFPVARFQGCYASIMGLPLGLVADLLRQAGCTPSPDWPQRCQALTGQCCHFDASIQP